MLTDDIVVVRKGLIDKKKFQTKTNLYEISFETRNGKSLTREQITKISNGYLKKIKSSGINFRVQTSVKYDSLPKYKQWRYGKTTTTLSNVPLTVDDPLLSESDNNIEELEFLHSKNEFKEFKILFWEVSKAGGCSENTNNDCLFLALELSNIKLPSTMNKPTKLKQYLKLDRKDRVPIDKLEQVADLIKHQIILIGDEKRIFGDLKKSITIKLHNNHYTLQPSKNISEIKYLGFKPKEQVLVYDSDYNMYPVCDGYSKDSMKKKYSKFGKYAFVCADDMNKKSLELSNDATLEDVYNAFILVADNLIEISENKINLYTCGTDIKPYILDLFNKSLNVTYQTDAIDCIESEFLSAGGGIMICNEEYEGYAYEYDMNSAYQSSMINNVFKVPLTKPTYEIFDETKHDYYPFGIYKADVIRSNDLKIDSYFTFRENKIYTHIDLTFAKELGLTIIHITNGNECNVALYKDCVVAKHLFENYINLMSSCLNHPNALSSSKNFIKRLRNLLHGLLSARNKMKAKPDLNNCTHFEFEDNDVEGIKPMGDNSDNYTVIYTPQAQPFKYGFARMLPFLTASVRCRMGRILKDNISYDNLIRSHTDSAFVKNEVDTLDIGDAVGQFKLKRCGLISVKNKRIYKWL